MTTIATSARPSFGEAFLLWLKIGCINFGGPAGQIALMHRTLVDEKKWVDEARFLHALNFCMLLPGPEAQKLATYLGWLLHGDPDTYRYIPASIRRYPGAEAVGRLMETRGFTDVNYLPVLGGLMAIHSARRGIRL